MMRIGTFVAVATMAGGLWAAVHSLPLSAETPVAGVPVEQVQLDKSFVDDRDVDSLAMVEIIVGCEEKFGVTIPDEESKNLKTVGDAVAYIEQHS